MTKHLLAIMLVLGIAACGGEASRGDDTSTTTQPATTTSEEQVTTTEPEYDRGLAPVVERARADLADRLGVDESSIAIVSAEPVTWSDGSLGCPEPGKFYTQALVEGNRVVLEHEARFYDYHVGADDEPFLCENPDSEEGSYDSIPPLEGAA